MSALNTSIRQITEHDAGLVVDFYTTLSDNTWFFFHPHPRDREFLEQMIHSLPQRPDLLLFMASTIQDGQEVMIGTVFFWDWHKKIPWFGIAARDGFQGQGLGDQMTAFAAEKARQNNKGGILLTTNQKNFPAQGLYKKHGFVTLGIEPHDEFVMILNFEA